MLLSFVALALAALYGWALLSWLIPATTPSASLRMVRGALAALLGIGLTSMLYFGWLVVVGRPSRWYFVAEAGLGGFLLLGAWQRRRRNPPRPAERRERGRPAWLVLGAVGSISLLAFAMIAYTLYINPYGAYDAWAIWNAHARFLFRGGAAWRQVFAPFASPHADYPYLVPAAVARLWSAAGAEVLLAPALLAMLWVTMTAGLLAGAVTLVADTTRGMLALAALLSTSHYVYAGSALLADVPVGALGLASLVCLALGSQRPREATAWFIVAGLCAGLATWTKNEGWLFMGVVGLVWSGVAWRSARTAALRRAILPFVLGVAPLLLYGIIFKRTLAPPSDLAAGLSFSSMAAKLSDSGRYATIGSVYALKVLTFGRGIIPALLLYSLFVGIDWSAGQRRIRIVTLLSTLGMLAGYTVIYLLTPHDLRWHVTSSVDRLIVQVWPSLLFGLFISTQSLARPLEARPAAA
jgi:hypothetical protein